MNSGGWYTLHNHKSAGERRGYFKDAGHEGFCHIISAKIIRIQGREAAVQLVGKMNEGFKKMPISDPNKLKTFIEGTTGLYLVSTDQVYPVC